MDKTGTENWQRLKQSIGRDWKRALSKIGIEHGVDENRALAKIGIEHGVDENKAWQSLEWNRTLANAGTELCQRLE